MNLLRKLFRTPESVDFSEHLPSYNPEKSSTSTFKSKLSSTDIEPELLESFKSDFLASPQSELAQTAIPNATLVNLLTDRNAVIRNPHVFSDKLKLDPNVTNQNSSGICWIYAATNTLRLQFMNKYNLDKFEFSQNFIFFYDKLEKCNFFLENLIQLSSSEPNPKSRSIQSLFSSAVGDGGFWDEAVNIIEKYGLVPQTEFPNTKHSINSKELNWIINNLLRGYGIKIRNEILVNKLDYDSIHVIKNGMMSDIYRVLVTTLGSPPTKFDWKFRDKNGKFKIHPNQTPLSFYNDFLKKSIGCSVKDMVSVAHNPTVALYSISISPYSGNVFSMRRQTTTNVPISILKKIAIEMIRKGDPVYFTCDVTEFFVKAKGLLDIRAVNYEAGFGVDVIGNMTKAERMEYGESYATHAMALTGVDVNQETGKIEQWRVENSWGSRDLFLGYLVMTDEWFDEFVYSVVCKDEILRKLRVDKLVKRCGIVNESPVWD